MGLLDRLKLRNREARKYTYAIYEYVQSKRTGRWIWKRRAVIEQPVSPYEIEDWPNDGYYQMRAIDKSTGTQRVMWTVYVEGGAVVEEDPELPTNTPTRQHTPAQAENPFAQIEQALQMLAYYRELFKKAGLIQDQREQLMETLMFLKEVQELKNTAQDILGGESKLPDNAPWWVHLLLPAVQSFSSLTSVMTQAYNPYLQPTYPYQYQQPVPAQPQSQPQQEEESLFTPPSPQTVKQVHKPRRKEEPKPEPQPEPGPQLAQGEEVEEVLDVDLNVDIPAELEEEEGGEEE